MATSNVSAQNNVITAAEYQQAADEITEIINAQRAERAPIEAEQELLRNRQELLIARQQSALNTLRAAEADPGDTAFLEQSRTAYARATGEVNATAAAIQQNRSVLAQSRQSTAELQEQRGALEVKAEFAEQGPPNQNSLPPPATTTPGQSATFVPTPPAPIPPTVTPASQLAAATPTATASAQNNVTTAAEYQQAADEITEIINVQRAERAPLEAELDQLRVRADTQAQRQQVALDALRDAEDIGDPAAIAAATTAYQRATNDLVVTSQAQQQIRSSLAQSRQSTAELQEQRGALEVKAEFAASGPPNQNSLPPPATVVPGQSATYVPPPPATVLVETSPKLLTDAEIEAIYPATDPQEVGALRGTTIITDSARQILSDPAVIAQQQAENARAVSPVPPTVTARELTAEEAGRLLDEAENPPAQNNVSTANQWLETENQIAAASRDIRAENVAITANIESLQSQQAAAARADRALENQVIDARLAGASDAEISQLEAQQIQAAARTAEITNQIRRQESVLFQNQETLGQLDQQRFIAEEAQFTAASGPPGLNSVPPPATVIPGQDPAAYDLPPQTYAENFQASPVLPDGDEALQAFDEPINGLDLPEQVDPAINGLDLPPDEPINGLDLPEPVNTLDDPEARAIQDAVDADLAAQEGSAFPPVEAPTPVGDEALQAIEDAEAAELAAAEGSAFAEPPPVSTLDDPEARAIQDAVDADLAAQEGSAFPPVEAPTPVGDEALQAIEDNQAAELAAAEGSAFAEPPPVNPELDEQLAQSTQAIEDTAAAELAAQEGSAFAPPVDAGSSAEIQAIEDAQAADLAAQEGSAFGAQPTEQGATKALTVDAQTQNTLNDRVNLPAAADWRVRLSLANGANYLYRAKDAEKSILGPLARTNGVVFPYTPSIETAYQAKYDSVDLTHSNYRGYFYRGSSVDQISIRGTFTAQDTREAEYLLAVITFFKSVTKMFYGATDPLAGTPPPLVFLSGLGQYQFNNNPCVVASFNYSLPPDVDYIRANGFNNYGINLDNRRQQSSGPPATGALGAIASVNRLTNNALFPGAIKGNTTVSNPVSQNNSKTNYTNSTYVPTKMEISLTLLPIQTRSQISSQFDLQKFATGRLLQQGFW